ncbi:ATP-binding protein [Streptomyces sp. NPDC004647]|uniref:ATP-binding protein n=1 Tax=Streptomyces sp. NPDC004647 TaxID=3154671 RepID=UPI0033AE497A
MDPNNRGPEEYGHDDDRFDERSETGARTPRPDREPMTSALGPGDRDGGKGPGLARTVQLVTGEYLLTVNPVDGSEIEPCPPGEHPGRPGRTGTEERAALRRASLPPVPAGPAVPELPLLERGEERERLARLISRGRSVRVTGPSGSGRTALLDAVAADCADLAPDGLVRLSGCHRTPNDLLYELYATVHHAPLYRPDRAELLESVHEIGAVVVLDDIEFGGSALDELLGATPECAFLISATPDVAAPSADSHLEELFLGGLARTTCLELLERAVRRPLSDEEAAWAADLWFESEGLPLRFVQAGALLRQRDALRADPGAFDEYGMYAEQPADAPFDADGHDVPVPTLAEGAAPAALLASRLSEAARETLRFAVALAGECPHQAHLPALAGDTHADAAVGELLGCGLLAPVGAHYRLAAGVAAQLEAAGYADDTAGHALGAAQHYAWWAGHPSVTAERAAVEADAILAAMAALVSGGDTGHPSAAVLLARTAAPAFAAALSWGAWERMLRHGQEAARLSGDVAEEAYFHHELGILALCTGALDRARAELEASSALRGALADRNGAVAGRRALALVADKSGAFSHGAGGTGAGEETSDARSDQSASPPGGVLARPGSDEAATVVTRQPAASGGGLGKRLGMRRTVIGGARRNVVAAGAGALLAAVLGTVVTLGATSGGDDGPPDRVESEQSASEEDGGDGITADKPPVRRATNRPQQPGESGAPGTSGTPGTGDSDDLSGEASEGGRPSSSKPGEPDDPDDPTRPPSPTRTSKPTKPPATPSSTPPSSTPSGSPSSSTSPTAPSGDTSNTASGSAPSSPDSGGPATSSAPASGGGSGTGTGTGSAPVA